MRIRETDTGWPAIIPWRNRLMQSRKEIIGKTGGCLAGEKRSPALFGRCGKMEERNAVR